MSKLRIRLLNSQDAFCLAILVYFSMYSLISLAQQLNPNLFAEPLGLIGISYDPTGGIYLLFFTFAALFCSICFFLIGLRVPVSPLFAFPRNHFTATESNQSSIKRRLRVFAFTLVAFLLLNAIRSGGVYHMYTSEDKSIGLFSILSIALFSLLFSSRLGKPAPIDFVLLLGVILCFLSLGVRITIIPLIFLFWRSAGSAPRIIKLFGVAMVALLPLVLISRGGIESLFDFLENIDSSLLSSPQMQLMVFGEFLASSLSVDTLLSLGSLWHGLLALVSDSLILFLPDGIRDSTELARLSANSDYLRLGGYPLFAQFGYYFGPIMWAPFYCTFFFALSLLSKNYYSFKLSLYMELIVLSVITVCPRQNIVFLPKFYFLLLVSALCLWQFSTIRVRPIPPGST